MMILTAAVAVLGVLCMLNLAVTTAVIRRLRQQPAAAGPQTPPGPGLAPGDTVPDFAIRPVHGPPVDGASLRGRHTVVAFFATACSICGDHAPRLAEQAPAWPSAGLQIVAAILDTGPDEQPHAPARQPAGDRPPGQATPTQGALRADRDVRRPRPSRRTALRRSVATRCPGPRPAP